MDLSDMFRRAGVGAFELLLWVGSVNNLSAYYYRNQGATEATELTPLIFDNAVTALRFFLETQDRNNKLLNFTNYNLDGEVRKIYLQQAGLPHTEIARLDRYSGADIFENLTPYNQRAVGYNLGATVTQIFNLQPPSPSR